MKPYIILLTLALVSCDKMKVGSSGPDALVIDDGMRALYGVSSIHGSFKAPEGSKYYIITTLEFEDGKLARRGTLLSSSVESLQGKSSSAQFLWDTRDGLKSTSLVTAGSAGRSDSEIWRRMVSSQSFGDESGPDYDGYKILGMGQSGETRAGVGNMGFGPDLDRALKERMFVGLLVVRFFSSEKEVDEFSVLSIPPTKEDAKQAAPSEDGKPAN